ncbi:transferase [Xylariaceae sp. FL1272]|nr:transferase [Xylariaceae sp. FL1272]
MTGNIERKRQRRACLAAIARLPLIPTRQRCLGQGNSHIVLGFNMAVTKSRKVRSVRRVFAATPPSKASTTKLSIADAAVARYSPCGAIWFFDRNAGFDARTQGFFDRFETALVHTLDEYPHYVGQVHWVTKELVAGDENPRHLGRPAVTYGSTEDPGFELTIVDDDRELSTLVPSIAERNASKKIWKASELPQNDFLPSTNVALSGQTYQGLPGAAAQLTAFKCGGFAVSVKFTHCLSDATCLLHFVHSWARRSRQLLDDQQVKSSVPASPVAVFDPSLLDGYAMLNKGSGESAAEKIRHARSLPMHRFSWWATDAPGYPSWATASSKATMPPDEELLQIELSPSTQPPWPTWDLGAAVEHVQIQFKAAEVAAMKAAAMKTLPEDLKALVVSRQDALLAHFWILINRARRVENLSEPVYMDMSLGMRNRLSPPLPDCYVGSPILMAYIKKSGTDAATETIGAVAGAFRQTVSQFTSEAISDYLFDAAHEVSPQRLWQGFLGSRHVMVTSWARARAYEVDFCGTRDLARYVQSQMPLMDGLLQLMDIADTGDFDVSIALEKGAMERLLSDPMLKEYGTFQ